MSHRRLLMTFRLAGCVLLGACHDAQRDEGVVPADGGELPILHRIAGAHSHEMRAMQVVVRDAATLSEIPLADVPVDFSKEMLLIVTLGRVMSDQYSVDIERVWREGRQLRVATTVYAPPTSARARIASPFCIAIVPRCDLNVAEFLTRPPPRERSWQQSAPPTKW